ncbi:MAG: AraC family transcriptional regulator [Yaniella sp.]|uniref:helix-turn-helix domain-containing protein n=1 Tax=Yaniella sp. TaxID=2773929 RepID=UPI0026495645|nr:AraC family transcriptional regulator [Yaniella sp.]MDN5730668.1 AraC family transcriptional regulator [Yaniella sp.]MDN5742233.1 AraC family transcriptional regulator [Yaniella sp.]MDN5815853.1 AraC family transcriptional regulator [Yaniella sp.]MDN5817651.1 AraC family transcriptional regulator [Yaniella sp.]MDN5837186.1 AraC family transcriptional regulator [Yaniella sp.]
MSVQGSATEAAVVDFVIATESDQPDRPVSWEPHTHPVHELTWVRNGVMTIVLEQRIWAVPEGWGLWMPAGVVHAGSISTGTQFHASFFATDHSTFSPTKPTCLKISALLHELLLHLERQDLAPEARRRAERVVFDLIEPASLLIDLPIPADRRLVSIAEALFQNPADTRTLDDWARLGGASSRTLARAFTASVGQSFTEWRRRLRMQRALILLAEGYPVAEVATEVGYLDTGSFIAAFRETMGETPGRFRENMMSDLANS